MPSNILSWVGASNTRKCFVLSGSIFLSIILVGATSLSTMYKMINRLYAPLSESNQLREKFILQDGANKDIVLPKLAYLKLQYRNIELYKEHHKEMGKIYYANYYTFTVILIVSSIFMGIFIFLIAESGWREANMLRKVAFFSFFTISSFFGIMTVTLDQKNNYQNNFGQYLYYDKIQNNILTFVNTSDQDSLHSKYRVDSFIVALNNDLKTNNQFFITIDASKVSLDDITGKLGKAINGNKTGQ